MMQAAAALCPSRADAAVPNPSQDLRFMRLALALGARHLGRCWPNPSVGAVVVGNEGAGPVIVGTGVTQPGGRPHAEPVALAEAGDRARGATLYVSLEPCAHHGRTPPCVDAVIAAGIGRVVSALQDPDPRVAGQGHARLRAAGIRVTTDLLSEEAARGHRGHIMRVRRGRPFITVKLARTADGFAGARSGARLLITGEAANARVHMMRAHADAVLVGIGTVLADDPLLSVRLPGLESRQPLRIVADSSLRTPPGCRLVASAREAPTWILCTDRAPEEAAAGLRERGVEVIRVPAVNGLLDPSAALEQLADRGLTQVLCEGGPHLADALAQAGLVDECVLLTGATSWDRAAGAAIPALGPGLERTLHEFVLRFSGSWDRDRVEIFAREGV